MSSARRSLASFRQTSCGVITVEEPEEEAEFDPNLVSIADCVINPVQVSSVDEQIAYAASIRNDNDVAVRGLVDFLLDGPGVFGSLPVMASTETVTINAGEIFAPREEVRALSNPVADQNNVVQEVVAEGGTFEITAIPGNVVEAFGPAEAQEFSSPFGNGHLEARGRGCGCGHSAKASVLSRRPVDILG